MVSPCKKRKVDRKGKESVENASSRSLSGHKKTNKLLKPLSDKKFYLDIKNHVSLKRIEEKLKSLGASLELFLVKDVDYVVTDRADYPRPSPSPYCSVSPATTDSPTDGVASKRTRSRAEAMLDRLKHQPQKASGDVLDNAISWRIPIYTLQRFLEWVGRVGRRGGLKLEVPRSRPDLRLFTTWPRPPFSSPPTRMTRKAGRLPKDSSSGAGGGYCEVCRIHYNDVDDHVISSGHIKLVTDPSQYSHLDSIIAQHSLGGGSRKSLRIAKSPPMGGKQSSPPPQATPPVLNGHVTRSSKNFSQPPPQQTTHNHVQQVECNGVGNSGEVQHNLRSTPGRRGRVSRKRLSAEEKLIEDNKAYYKVEVLNSKLRSTGYMISQKAVEESRVGDEDVEDLVCEGGAGGEPRVNGEKTAKEAPPVVVRFKKVRRSQLALLSDEAESFMFGEKRSSSSDEEEEERREENKKKRRTHAEAFIHDNLDYYKFVMAGSRLSCPPCRSAGAEESSPSGKRPSDEVETTLSEVEFGFERCCGREAWVETYRRLDRGQERYLRLHHDYPSLELPAPRQPSQSVKRPGSTVSSLAGTPAAALQRRHRTVSTLVDDKPRKSPRCHASTLAILSSLTRRGRAGREPVIYTEEESLPETVVSSSSLGLSDGGGGGETPPPVPEHRPRLVPGGLDRVAECLTHGRTSWSHGPCLDIDPRVINSLEDTVCLTGMEFGPTLDMGELVGGCPEPWGTGPASLFLLHHTGTMSAALAEVGSCDGSDCSDVLGFLEDGRVVLSSRRKRKRKKRNLTGWPLEKIKKKPPAHPPPPPPPPPTTPATPSLTMPACASAAPSLLSSEPSAPPTSQTGAGKKTEAEEDSSDQPTKRRVGRPPKKHKLSVGSPLSLLTTSSPPVKRKSRL